MAHKKYDPLWEIVGEKLPLQGQEPDVDAVCPYCQVRVHVGREAKVGARYACGLCGGLFEVLDERGERCLRAVEPSPVSSGKQGCLLEQVK